MSILPLAVDLLNPIVWNLPGNAAKKFYSFSCTEFSSVFDLTLAANKTSSDERAADYVRHLQDEKRHTTIFLNRANKLRKERNKPLLPHPHAEYEELFTLLGEKRFLAFVHAGEKRGCIQFSSYAKYFAKKGDENTAAVFNSVLADETHHMNYTWDLLVEMCGSVDEAKKEVRLARRWEMRRTWMRTGRAMTGKLFFIITISIYPLFLPYKLLSFNAYPKTPSWKKA